MAAAIPAIIAGVVVAGATVGATALLAPKPSKVPTAIPAPTRTAALSQAMSNDTEFRRRQGAAATMVTGASGAEAPSPGAKALLGQ